MRGEHTVSWREYTAEHGSSPHARGALAAMGESSLRNRLIPACAGSTKPDCSRCPWPEAHPRMRGEHGGATPCLS